VVYEFPAVVALNTFDDRIKLSLNIGEKPLESRGCVRFVLQGKRPSIVREIIDNNQIIFMPGKTSNM
jgi:hypothetical protein